MILLIDNYDSFTYNLAHYIGEQGAEIKVIRNDAHTPDALMDMDPNGIVLSPGPGYPQTAGVCLELIEQAALRNIPLFGVCLGHQAIGHAFGGQVVQCHEIVHGKIGHVTHDSTSVFASLPSPFKATRYHSLVVDEKSLPACLRVTARLENGLIMGLEHREKPIHGVQFHPESIATEYGHELIKNFLDMTKQPA